MMDCSWDAPGHNPFMGDVPAAVHAYADIPPLARTALQAKMERRQYDDIAVITKDSIKGSSEYTGLRGMHFGDGRVCQYPTRTKWADSAAERGLVYCVDSYCVIVPTVCRNVSRVDKVLRDEPSFEQMQQYEPPALPALSGPDGPSEASTFEGATQVPGTSFNASTGLYGPFQGVPVGLTPGITPAVPEPETYALMLAGLALVMAALRKRNAAVVQ